VLTQVNGNPAATLESATPLRPAAGLRFVPLSSTRRHATDFSDGLLADLRHGTKSRVAAYAFKSEINS
jgi:thiamine monophosphate kinase